MEPKETEKRNRKKMVILLCAILAVAILLIAGKFIYDLYQNTMNGDPSYSEDAVDWNESIGDEEAEEGYISIPGYEEITLEAGSETAKIALVNPETNECLFQFELILKETEEVLYTSDMVLPGKAITREELSTSLEAGEYTLIIRVNTFSLDGKEAYNGSDLEVPLYVYEE